MEAHIARRGSPAPAKREPEGPRANRQVRARRVMVVDETGEKLGEFLIDDALELARVKGLDLVEVAPDARPPVCRIADLGKLKYERSKRQQASRKNQKNTQLKQVKIRPKTADHDIEVVVGKVRAFLEAGHTVRVNVWFRGREHAHHDIGAEQCQRIADGILDVGRVGTPPKMEGRNMVMTLLPGAST